MKVKFGAIVVDGRGKVGGHVFSKNRSGAIMRTKVTPVNAQTARQVAARALLTQFSRGFNQLTAGQIAAWNAATEEWANTNVFGDSVKPSGKNLYVRLNSVLSNIGATPLTEPPTPGDVVELSELTASFDIGSGATVINASNTDNAQTYIVDATAPHSRGRTYVKGRYRQIAIVDGQDLDGYDYEGDYEGKFGLPSEGEVVSVRVYPVNQETGQKGQGSTTRATVVDTP